MKKSVLITGSSHGIGAACAVAFAREGYDVGINYLHSPEDAQKVAEQCRELGADAQIYQADVSLHEDCVRMIDAFIEHFGKINVLVNNAGGALKMPKGGFVDMPVEYWNKQIDLNLNSAMYCSQAAARDMIAKGIHGLQYALDAELALSRIVSNAEQMLAVPLEPIFERDVLCPRCLQQVFALVYRNAHKPGLLVLRA